MKPKFWTWAVTLRWPPAWPFARFWAVAGDVAAELRANRDALVLAEKALRHRADDTRQRRREPS